MEKNIFEGAKFGDKFLTRDGKMVLFDSFDTLGDKEGCVCHHETLGDIFYDISTNKSPEMNEFGPYPETDIVSRYQEPIDEKKLDDYITKHYIEIINKLPVPYDDCFDECVECYKMGLRDAMGGAMEGK